MTLDMSGLPPEERERAGDMGGGGEKEESGRGIGERCTYCIVCHSESLARHTYKF